MKKYQILYIHTKQIEDNAEPNFILLNIYLLLLFFLKM